MPNLEERELGTEDGGEDEVAVAAAARLKEYEEKLRVSEIARARAEGEAEAMRRTPAPQGNSAPAPITEDQWQSMEAETGKTRQQIQADAKLMAAIAEERTAPVRKQAAEAEDRARKAEERAQRAEGKHSLSRIEDDFYKNNPGLSAHRGDVDAFLAKFPDASKEDPKKLAELLADAKVYVRGKVREDVGNRRRSEKSGEPRDIGRADPLTDDDEESSPTERLDLDDLDNEGARMLVSRLHRNIGKIDNRSEKRSKETVEQWKRDSTRDGRGVAIDASEEFARGSELLDGDSPLGGARGAR